MTTIDSRAAKSTAAQDCYNLGPVEQIPVGEGRQFLVDGRQVAVFCTRAGDLYAVQAECPHQAGPLADGIVGGATVICPLHARKFHLGTGEQIGGDCTLTTYPVRLNESGDIILQWTEGNQRSLEPDRL